MNTQTQQAKPAALTWGEVRDMQMALPYYVNAWRIAKAAADQSALALNARRHAAENLRRVYAIGDRLTRELVVDCGSLDELIRKHRDHGYRPTLNGKVGSPEWMLALAYDTIAEANGLEARAFRGAQS